MFLVYFTINPLVFVIIWVQMYLYCFGFFWFYSATSYKKFTFLTTLCPMYDIKLQEQTKCFIKCTSCVLGWELWCLTPLSTTFKLYRDGRVFCWWIYQITGRKHRPAADHWQTLSHNVVSSTPSPRERFKLATLVVIDTDCVGRYNIMIY